MSDQSFQKISEAKRGILYRDTVKMPIWSVARRINKASNFARRYGFGLTVRMKSAGLLTRTYEFDFEYPESVRFLAPQAIGMVLHW